MKDGYEEFFRYFKINTSELWGFAEESMVYVDYDKTLYQWEALKKSIETGNDDVYIRSYGRNGKNSKLFLNLYKKILPNANLRIDPTNNAEPKRLLKNLTNYSREANLSPNSKYKKISNYQISHVFGKTINPYSFGAAWNIIYLPKILDPFTGHEATEEIAETFSQTLQIHTIDKFGDLISEYNEINEKLYKLSESYLEELVFEDEFSEKSTMYFQKSIKDQFSIIKI